jgi:hypothetical protein
MSQTSQKPAGPAKLRKEVEWMEQGKKEKAAG